jgi:hypothetical protein
MKEKKLRRLLVKNENGKPKGIISLGNIATKTKEFTDEVINKVSEPSEPQR